MTVRKWLAYLVAAVGAGLIGADLFIVGPSVVALGVILAYRAGRMDCKSS